ncbi:MAG: acyl carrier protein [Phycisphaerae bacterium]|nr:acyl carrier protein [Phycisphaerae bacterium]
MDKKLQGIICDVFRVSTDTYHPQLTSADVESWDSVLHITLLLTLEQTFGVSFDPEEGSQLISVPAIKAALSKRNIPDAGK